MNKIFSIILMLSSAACLGQTTNTSLVLSREQAIKIGLQNRFDIKANQFNTAIAESEIKQAKYGWLPEINGHTDLKYNTQLQQTILPGGIIPGFNEDALFALGAKNEGIYGLHLSQPVFDAAILADVKLAKNNLAMQKEKNREEEINIKLAISQAYLNVQLRELQKKIAGHIALRNKEYVEIAEGRYKNGALIENHYLRAKLDQDNANVLLTQASQEYELSLLHLRYQLNIPAEVAIQLSDSLETNPVDFNKLPSGERTEISQLRIKKQEYELELKRQRGNLLPSISMEANYSKQFLSERFNYGDSRWWSPFSYVALHVRIPISAHFKNKVNTAGFNQKISQNDLLIQQRTADVDYEVHQALSALKNARSNMKDTRANYELSGIIFRNQQQQYRLGVLAYSDLLDTEKSLSATERNYIQRAYEFVLAQINLQKATNNF